MENINIKTNFNTALNTLQGTIKYLIDDVSNIDKIVTSIYKAIFKTVDAQQMSISFIKHFIPQINERISKNETVYECFNKGRYKAYENHFGNDVQKWHIPAASAVGNSSNFIEISFTSVKNIIQVIENKCQNPASQYSKKYGEFPPVFSRASIVNESGQIKMYASGTASIKGEDSQYGENLYDQIYNTIENLRILGSQFNLKQYGLEYGFAVEDISKMFVYYRNSSDLPFLERLIPRFLSSQCTIEFRQSNICRQELLVEMEPVFIKKGDKSVTDKKYKIKNNRIITESFELHLSEHCNLSCAECCNISPLNDPKFISIDEIVQICEFLQKYLNPEVIKLSGGEPLLHSQLSEIIKIIKSYFPKTKLRLTSNGLLANRLNSDIFKYLDQIWISNYKSAPVNKKQIEKIIKLARENEVIYNIKSVDQFNKIFVEEELFDRNEIQEIYNDCWMRHRCLMIRNNRFFKCTRAAYIDTYLKKAKDETNNLTEGDSISIDDDEFLTKALNFLNSEVPLQSCSYCLGVSGELIENKQIRKENRL